MNERTRKAIGNMPLNDRRKILGDVAMALSSGVTHGEQSIHIVTVIIEALGPKLHEAMAEPDPADLTTYASALLLQEENEKLHERVKVLEAENKKLRDTIGRLQWMSPLHGLADICKGCGASCGSDHSPGCPIYNALNPKPAETNCPECEHARPRDLGDRVSADRYCAAGQLQPEKLKGNAFPFCRDVYKQDCQHFHKADS